MFRKNIKQGSKIRLIGLSVSHLTGESYHQENLFEEQKEERLEKLDLAIDAINKKYGKKTMLHAKHLDNEFEHRSTKKE